MAHAQSEEEDLAEDEMAAPAPSKPAKRAQGEENAGSRQPRTKAGIASRVTKQRRARPKIVVAARGRANPSRAEARDGALSRAAPRMAKSPGPPLTKPSSTKTRPITSH